MRSFLAISLGFPLLALAATPPSTGPGAPEAVLGDKHRALLDSHCKGCHGPEKQKGKFRVDDLSFRITDSQTAERWQKVLDALNSGEMPPEEEKQPGAQPKADLLDELAHALVTARRALSDQHGLITLRRLNQREFKNTLRALLGVDVDTSDLPADTDASRFDTVGANLFMSGNQFEQYESIAREALDEATVLHAAHGTQKLLRIEVESTNSTIRSYVAENLDAHERAKAWVKAVEEAANRPENAAAVAELRRNSKNDALFRRSWEKIQGAPSPESFGFSTVENNADKANRAFANGHAYLASQTRYLQKSGLETGAYLTLHDIDGGLNGSLFIKFPPDFPPGDYKIRVRAGLSPQTPPERRFIDFGFKGRSRPTTSVHEVTGTPDNPSILEIPFHRNWKHRDQNAYGVYIREKGTADSFEQLNLKREEGRKRDGIGVEPVIWVDWIEIERIPEPEAAVPPGLRALAGIPLDDKQAAPKPEALREAFQRFAVEAFRGALPSERYTDRLLTHYQQAREQGAKHSIALRETLAVVLASPKFLYRAEPADSRRPLRGLEMATRLSFLLWGEPPDSTLRALGESGELLTPPVLLRESNRLLDDARSMEFVRSFTRQWLNLDRLDFFQFNPARHPRFDYATKLSAKDEVYESVALLLRENGSVRNLLKADYAVVNPVLADYYGLPEIHGDHFRKVPLPPGSPRGGLLGMAAILAMGSNGEHTSPVERGAWILRKVLNEPPPPAPANVPALTRLAGQVLTTKERVMAHQENPQCASCHRKIDPLGFALENFDAAGLWRTQDSYQALDDQGKPIPKAVKTRDIDPSGAFHRGPNFKDFQEMRSLVAARDEAFARGLISALVEFGLGRPCGFSDESLVDSLLLHARTQNLSLRALLHALIQSEPFHLK